jgi:hypothetical protein
MAVMSAQTSLDRVGEWAKEMRIYGGPVSTDISGSSRRMGEGNDNLWRSCQQTSLERVGEWAKEMRI